MSKELRDLPYPEGRILASGEHFTWDDLIDPWERNLPPVAVVLAGNHLQALRAVVLAARDRQREILIVAANRVEEQEYAGYQADGFAIIRNLGEPGQEILLPTQERLAEAGRVWLLTSGSTGRPKRVAHTLESLSTVGGRQPARTWLCPYTPGAYAWWQVVTLGLFVAEQSVVCVAAQAVEEWPHLALQAGVTAASGTPTFWRQALWRSGPALRLLPLQQITLGGEPVDQPILDALAQTFPQARISWIYASSEAGAAIAVHDGKAGFPESWLEQNLPGKPRISVREGQLFLTSPHAAAGMSAEIATGDAVRIADGRVFIIGRLGSDEINVGGAKVSAGEVRAVLLDHPAVAWAQVRGRRAPLVGAVVEATIVFATAVDPEDRPNAAKLRAWCAQKLSDYAVPRRIRVLDSIPLKESLKSDV